MKKKIQILLVDDHAIVRAGFKLLLSNHEEIEVMAEAERGEQAIQQYLELQPDMIVMDLSMPGIGGLETIRRIVKREPAARILVFSVHHEQVFVNRAISAGARGYITKNTAPDILPEAIMAIMEDRTYIETGLLQASEAEMQYDYHRIIEAFSTREFDIFKLLAQGQSTQKIATELCLGYKTVANYVTKIKKKLHVETLSELMQIAIASGITSLPEGR